MECALNCLQDYEYSNSGQFQLICNSIRTIILFQWHDHSSNLTIKNGPKMSLTSLFIFHFSSLLARIITGDIGCPHHRRIKFKSCSRKTPKMAVSSVVSPDWPPLVSLLVHHVSTYAVRLNLYSCWARIVFTERNLSQDHVWGSTFQQHWENGHFVRLLFFFVSEDKLTTLLNLFFRIWNQQSPSEM